MPIKSIGRFRPFQLFAAFLLLFAGFLVIFSFYQLFVFFGVSLVLAFGMASVLIFVVILGLKEAGHKMSLKESGSLLGADEHTIRRWAKRQYYYINLFLASSLLAALGLVALGVILLYPQIAVGNRGGATIIMGVFGLVILLSGAYLLKTLIREMTVIISNKDNILTKLIEQANRGLS
jgi:hypothetical protein